jgi:hypothetical protein
MMSNNSDSKKYTDVICSMGLGIPWPLIDEDMERNLEKVLLACYCQHVPSESRMVLSTKLTRFRYATVLKLENTLRPSLLNYKFQKHLVSSRKITNSDHGELGSHQSAAVYNLGGQILGPYFNKLWKTPPLYNDLFIHSLDQHLHSKWQKSRQKEGGIEMEKVRQRNYERILYRRIYWLFSIRIFHRSSIERTVYYSRK